MEPPGFSLSVIGIAAFIALGVLFYQHRRLAQSRAEIQRLALENSALPEMNNELTRLRCLEVDHAELTNLRAQAAVARVELPRLRAKAAEVRRIETEAARLRAELDQHAVHPWEFTRGITAPIADLMQSGLEQQCRRQALRMQERLDLSPDQTQSIQEILVRKARGRAEAAKRVLDGRLDREKLAAFRQGNLDSESQISALLSPEQQIAHAAFQEEEMLNQARSVANGELVQMQRTLDLQEGQLDTVFAALYEQALQRNAAANDSVRTDPIEPEQRAINGKLQALQGVLTPTQLASYREQQEVQLNFYRRIADQMESLESTQ